MKPIEVSFVEGSEQRYPTCGDYWEDDNKIYFRITKQVSEDAEVLVLLHEFIEYFLTRKRVILEQDITNYDMEWEERLTEADEPGNEEDCIYKKEHRFSENIERQMAHELEVDWFEYEKNLKVL